MTIRIASQPRLALTAMLLLATGCGRGSPVTLILPDTVPFHYHGQTLLFPKGTVEVRDGERGKAEPYARLMPDKPASKQSIDARYNIDLGRTFTGQSMGGGYWLGFLQYPPDSPRTDLGDGYVMFCAPPSRQMPAFDCAVLLKSLPFAAIQFKDVPSSPEAARLMVMDAEAYLTRAKTGQARP